MTHTVNDQRGCGASNYTYAQNYAMGVAQLAGIDRDGRLQLRTERWANLKRHSRIQQMKHTEHKTVPCTDHTNALLVPAGARLSSQRDERFDSAPASVLRLATKTRRHDAYRSVTPITCYFIDLRPSGPLPRHASLRAPGAGRSETFGRL